MTPASQGYYHPAEFANHTSTWLSWPHKEASWPGKIESIFPVYADFIKLVAEGEIVNINVLDDAMKSRALGFLHKVGADLSKIKFWFHPTDDAWCRDHGPAFLVNSKADVKKVIVDWGYNAWGGKYPPFDLDDHIPTLIGEALNIPVYHPGIVMEGGSVDFNGKGTVLTTKNCLLNKNRNPHLNQQQIEGYLRDYYGVTNILWLGDGIDGDDTDGHIDDLTRFVNETTVVTVVEHNKKDPNFKPLKENTEALAKMKLENGKPIDIIELPMPGYMEYKKQRLPVSYANFYISNKYIVMPVFKDKNDDKASDILQACFPDRKVVGLDCRDIIWGLGAFHCLSHEEPAV
ncbi:MAG TPA: agmatine deiminase family protein [Cyclobacteriaceae bacterium]|nr:agmatine deiminase family protein [Cyclobacteriaceae bacterium]